MIFILDVVLMFVTTYQNIFCEEITDRTMIRIHYMNSFSFFVDMMSVLGILKHFHEDLGILSLFKIFRINRLKHFIEGSNLLKKYKLMLSFFEYALYYLLIFHFVACFWFYSIKNLERIESYMSPDWIQIDFSVSAKLENWYQLEWIPPRNAIQYPDVELLKSVWDLWYRYAFLVYNSIMFMGLGDIFPNGESFS